MNYTQTSHQIPIFQAVYQLFLSWYIRCQTLPKRDRFSIGHKVEGQLLEILTLIVTAYHTKNSKLKREALGQIDSKLECIKITMRLAKDVKALELRWYVEYEGRLQETGKMLGGWMNSLKQN